MKVLSIALCAGEMRISVLSGTVDNPILLEKKRLIVKDDEDVSVLMDWHESNILNEVNRIDPSKIVCKLNLGVDKKQSITQIMPLGIFSLIAKRKGIPFLLFTSRQFTPTKLSLPKGTNLYNKCDELFGIQRPYWDKQQKDTILGAWMSL